MKTTAKKGMFVTVVLLAIGVLLFVFTGPDAHFQTKDGKITLDKTDFKTGITKSDTTLVPDFATEVKVVTSREGLPKIEGEVIQVKLDLYDGKKWVENFMGFGTTGGEAKTKDGQIATSSTVYRKLPHGKGRKVRLQLNSHADLQTLVSVEFQ